MSSGYFNEAYRLSHAGHGFDYVLFGGAVLFSPIAVPLYWIGRLAAHFMEDTNE